MFQASRSGWNCLLQHLRGLSSSRPQWQSCWRYNVDTRYKWYHKHQDIHIYIYIHISIYIYINVYIYIYIYIYITYLFIYLSIYLMCIYVYISCIYIYIYVCVCLCMCLCIYVYMYIYIRICRWMISSYITICANDFDWQFDTVINFTINPPLWSQDISRTRPWCHASVTASRNMACVVSIVSTRSPRSPRHRVPPWLPGSIPRRLFPAFGSQHGPPGSMDKNGMDLCYMIYTM